MRATLEGFEVARARRLDDVLARFAEGGWSALAGGTDLMVTLGALALAPCRLVDVWAVPELRGITVHDDVVVLGALTTYADVQAHPLLVAEFPMLVAAARLSGAAAIQNRGTLGGNVANASPAADSPPALLAYGAELELVSRAGRRRVPYRGFHTGYKTSLRRPDEIIAALVLPRPRAGAAPVQHYRKVGTRKAQAIAKVGLAFAMELRDGVVQEVRLGLSSVAATPLFAERTADCMRGQPLRAIIDQAVATLASEVTPIDDVRSSGAYRRRVAVNLLRDALEAAAAGRAPVDSL